MCTLSVLRRPIDEEAALWRVSFNRDERRTRPRALAPVRRAYGHLIAISPIDPAGGGTWIAMSSAGIVFALLNGYSPADAARPSLSRGLIIPSLLSEDTLEGAAARLRALDATAFASFRLVMIDDAGAREAVSDGRHLECHDVREDDAWMRSSSSVRPEIVFSFRDAEFQRNVVAERSTASQDRLHFTRQAADPAMGVLMEREDARTVSITTVTAFATGMRMTYRPLEADAAAPADAAGVAIELARQPR